MFVPHILASLATLLPLVVAGPPLPDYPIPGERPPILMKNYFGAHTQLRLVQSFR
jgi:hypothetical protein